MLTSASVAYATCWVEQPGPWLSMLGPMAGPGEVPVRSQGSAAEPGAMLTRAWRAQVLLSEVAPAKLARLAGPQAWVQVACPRLSIDWGEGFALPTLTPFEALVALGEVRPPEVPELPLLGSHCRLPEATGLRGL